MVKLSCLRIARAMVVAAAAFSWEGRNALANADSDQVVRESAIAAVEAGSSEAARRWADAQAGGGVIGPGTAVIGGISLGVSLYEFGHAKTDKERFFSGLSAGASAYLLLGGPYGAAVGMAVSIVSAVNAGLDAQASLELLRIYKRTEEYQRAYIESKTKLASADLLALNEIILHLRGEIAAANTAQAALTKQCSEASEITALQEFDACGSWISSFYLHAENVVFDIDRLLSWDSEFISSTHLFDSMELRREDLVKARSNYAAVIEDSNQRRKEFTELYATIMSEVITRRALDSAQFSTEEYLASNCQDNASNLALAADTILSGIVARRDPYSATERSAVLVRMNDVLQSLTAFDRSACREFAAHDDKADGTLLREWLKHLATTKSLLENRFAALQ